MGRKNNKHKTKKGRGSNSSTSNAQAQTAVGRLAFLEKSQREAMSTDTHVEPPLFPAKPNMALDGAALQRKLLAIPAKKRTATAERLSRANEMIEDIKTLQKIRTPSNETFVDIGTLKADDCYVRECVLWIGAFVSSDFRVSIPNDVLGGSPMPECYMHITSLHPLDDNQPQLMRVDALPFVVLLATAMRINAPRERISLQIVHELHAHAEGEYDWLDFDDLRDHEETRDLDEAYLRYALAGVGIKRARNMYRNPDQWTVSPFQSKDDVAIKSKTLLKSIETFANEQVRYLPESPAGHWNLGWVSSQPKHNGRHPWKAASDFYNHMAECCLRADRADDDFYRAEAAIEVAMSLVIGGKPIVGFSVPSGAKVQVLRNLSANNDGGYCAHGPTPAAGREVTANEQRRLREGIPPTRLERGETVLVPHWEVSRAWNFAMDAYLRVEKFGHGQYVYGESQGWDIADGFLKGSLVPRNYTECPQVGFNSTRDKGSWLCDFCGEVGSNLQQCSLCKKAHYCNRDCQVKAWRARHKRECIPVE